MSGFIKLHRSILDWQHWDDHNTTRLLIYLLVAVNFEDKVWKGQAVKAGSIITSYEKLAVSTGMTVSQIRRSLTVLKNDKQIEQKTTNKNQLVTLTKWEELQVEQNKKAGKRQTNAQQKNSKTATTKEDILFNNNISRITYQEKHSLIVWLELNTPRVQGMNEPITNEQSVLIQNQYNAVHVAEVFQSMHNYKKLNDNQSAYLTFLNWMRRRQQTDAKYGLKEEATGKPKIRAAWD